MKKKPHEKKKIHQEQQSREQGSARTVMKQTGKFLHGTRGKPGRSPHGDKHY